MPGRQAKLIAAPVLRRMLAYARNTEYPERNRAIVLLSVKAGLRAAEIAQLTWPMVLDARGRVGDVITVPDRIAKKGGGRRIPMHPDLAKTLRALKQNQDCSQGSIVKSARGGPLKPNSIVNWFIAMFAELEIEGCSSHSGRRSFITAAARNVHRVGCSLRDVQLLAGHRSIETTQRYIDGHTAGQRRLVFLL
jgi:integrase